MGKRVGVFCYGGLIDTEEGALHNYAILVGVCNERCTGGELACYASAQRQEQGDSVLKRQALWARSLGWNRSKQGMDSCVPFPLSQSSSTDGSRGLLPVGKALPCGEHCYALREIGRFPCPRQRRPWLQRATHLSGLRMSRTMKL